MRVCTGRDEEVVERAAPRATAAATAGQRPPTRATATASAEEEHRLERRARTAARRRPAGPRSAPPVPSDRQHPAERATRRGSSRGTGAVLHGPSVPTIDSDRPPQPTCTCGRRCAVRLGPAQHLAGHRRDLAAAEQQEPQEAARPGCPRSTRSRCAGCTPVTSRMCSSSAASAFGTDERLDRQHPVAGRAAPRRARRAGPRSRDGSVTVTSTKITSGSAGRSWSRRICRILSTYSSRSRSSGSLATSRIVRRAQSRTKSSAGGVEVDLGGPQLERPA